MFYPLFWTQFLGAFNDNFLKNALVIIVTIQALSVFGFSPAQTVVVAGGVFIFPFFLFSAIAGQLSDKYDKSKVLQATKILEICIMLFSASALLMENYEFLLVTLFFMGLQSTFFGPAKFSILPQILKEEEMIGGNALIEAGTFLAILLGTILGGVIVALPYGHLAVSLLLVAIALVGYGTSRGILSTPVSEASLKIQWNPLTTTWQMMRLAHKDHNVFWAILAGSWFWFVGASILSILPTLCVDYLKSDSHLITLFLTVFSVGIGVGSFLCEKLSHEKLVMGMIPVGSLGISFFMILLFLCTQYYHGEAITWFSFLNSGMGMGILICLFGLSVMSGLYIVPINTLIQERSDAMIRSRVISANNIINAFFMVVASLALLALLKLSFTIPVVFAIVACLNLMTLFILLRKLPETRAGLKLWIGR